VLDVGPRSDETANSVIRENFPEKFGADFFVSVDEKQFALGRVFENVVSIRS
jgi:hypothetical protein